MPETFPSSLTLSAGFQLGEAPPAARSSEIGHIHVFIGDDETHLTLAPARTAFEMDNYADD
jgi:hypothetical protein